MIVSQPKPAELEKSPFFTISKKYNIKVEYKKFFKVDRISSRDFREQKIYLNEYPSVIFTSRLAVDYYFSMAKDLRFDIPETTKYFCVSETIALYLQKHIQFRKRRVFSSNNSNEELADMMKRFEKEPFLLPCSGEGFETLNCFLLEKGFNIKKAVFYRNESEDLSAVDIESFDMIVVFSPNGVKSLKENFPNLKTENKVIAAFGDTTAQTVVDLGWNTDIKAPCEKFPSMAMAIESYLKLSNKKK